VRQLHRPAVRADSTVGQRDMATKWLLGCASTGSARPLPAWRQGRTYAWERAETTAPARWPLRPGCRELVRGARRYSKEGISTVTGSRWELGSCAEQSPAPASATARAAYPSFCFASSSGGDSAVSAPLSALSWEAGVAGKLFMRAAALRSRFTVARTPRGGGAGGGGSSVHHSASCTALPRPGPNGRKGAGHLPKQRTHKSGRWGRCRKRSGCRAGR
jgi:hypothetical protein